MGRALTKRDRLMVELERLIRSGDLGEGDRLPGEHALAERYAVSRTTVRQALASLKREGLIATAAGAGSFVTYDGRDIDERLSWSWSEALSSLVVAEIRPPQAIHDRRLAAELGLVDDAFIAVDRVRASPSGERVTLERSRLPYRPQLDPIVADGLRNGSLTQSMAAAGLIPHSGEEVAEIARLDDDDARTLRRSPGVPFLRLSSRIFDREGVLVEAVTSLLDPDRFRLRRMVGGPPHVR